MLLLLSACTLFNDDLRDQRWAELTADSSVDDSAPSPDADADGWTVADGDCDDADAAIHPDAEEVCDHVDNDCDRLTDEDPYPTERFPDNDGDGYGNGRTGSFACFPGDGWIENGDDCNDVNPDIHPGADEVCNGADDDCDGFTDNHLEYTSWFGDGDGDGYGVVPSINACQPPGEGWVTTYGDCDDTRAEVNPAQTEVCSNGLDDDCDGERECGWYGEREIEAEASARILGDTTQRHLGVYLTTLGDVDGDGVEDLAVGDSTGTDSALYVFRGALAGDRTSAAASLQLEGDGHYARIVYSHELEAYLVQDAKFEGFRGAVYEIPLSTSGVIDLSTLTPRWEGGIEAEIGHDLAISSNLTGDGTETVVLASPYSSEVAYYAGEVQLLTTDGIEVASFRGQDVFEVFGENHRVLSDLDGDGLDDLALGAWGPEGTPELAYVANLYLAPFSGTLSRSDADATLQGEEGEELGEDDGFASADFTGDGYNDLVVNGPNYFGDDGAIYILPGPLSSAWGGHPTDVADYTQLDEGGTPVFARSFAVADFDADGAADLAIGSPYSNYRGNDDGTVHIVYGPIDAGHDSVGARSFYLDEAEFHGPASADYQVGYEVAAFNVNGDEFPDLAVGSPFVDIGSLTNAGTTWIILGDGS